MTKPARGAAVAARASDRVAGKDPPTTSEIKRKFAAPADPPIKEASMDFSQQGLRPNAASVNRLSESAEERRIRVAESLRQQDKEGPSEVDNDKINEDQEEEKEEEDEEDRNGEVSRYTDDPDPPPTTATKEEQSAYRRSVLDYTRDMFEAYESMALNGEDLWFDFTTAFRPQSIREWPRPTASKWADLLIQRGIHVNLGKRKPLASALIDLLYRETHVPTSRMDMALREVRQEMKQESAKPEDQERPNKVEETCMISIDEKSYGGGPGDSDSSTSSDDDGDKRKGSYKGQKDKRDTSAQEEIRTTKKRNDASGTDSRDKDDNNSGLGVNGLMKAYTKQKQFSGSWDDDLDTMISVYDTMAQMCGALPEEKLQAMPVMLCGDALNFYAERVSSCETYEEATDMLRKWYNSTEKKSRILHVWQRMLLSEAMSENPEASQVDVFRTFIARLMSLQKQLDKSYHSDQFLRDRLLSAVDIPDIQVSLRDRVPRTSASAINRIANRLSEKPRTAGTATAFWMHDEEEDEAEALYSLGRTYGGQARNVPRTPWKRGPFNNRGGRGGYNGGGGSSRGNRFGRGGTSRRLNSGWLRGVKGCFVCGRNHMAREKHSRDEVTAAIRKLRDKQPSALLTIDDVVYLQDTGNNEEGELDDTEENEVLWAEDELGDQEASVYVVGVELQSVEQDLSNAAYAYGSIGMDSGSFAKVGNRLTNTAAGGQLPFLGIRMDTCANRASVMSIYQYNSYCAEFKLPSKLRRNTVRTLSGIGGSINPIAEAHIQIPFLNLRLVIDVHFLIVTDDVPSLLCVKDMVDNNLDLSVTECVSKFEGRTEPLLFENYFLIYRWSRDTIPFVMYTQAELETIHRSFGHPSVRATAAMLKRAKGEDLDKETRKALKSISRNCNTCALEAAPPRRFKLTIGTDTLKFNHCVQVDTMFINSKAVLHIVDEATHLCAATFLRKQSSFEIWNAIQRLWMNVYLGPPDYLAVDQGTAYVSKEMREKAEAHGITIREAPIETPGSIGVVERYHAPLRRAYECIRRDLDRQTTDDDCLSMAVYAVNTTTGPEGLCPILLVYGAMPRPARTAPAPSQLKRSMAIESAKTAVQKEQAKRRIAFGLRHKAGPKAKEASDKLRRLPAGASVLVYRKTTGKWEGPFKFVSIDGETVVIQLPRGRRIFRSVCVRPYQEEPTNGHDHEVWQVELSGRSRKATGTKEQRRIQFAESRAKELQGLIDNGTFIQVDKNDIPEGSRIFGSRFVDELKKMESGVRNKSRLVAQNYGDIEAGRIATKAPTVQRFSCRILMALAASTSAMTCYTRDITQAYVQSTSTLERDVFISAPEEMGLGKDAVLKVVKPLYGIPESGLHWYITYIQHHLRDLNMQQTTGDPCLLFKRSKDGLCGLVALQVDDSLIAATTEFSEAEETAVRKFKSKDRVSLQGKSTVAFNGMDLAEASDGKLTASQTPKIRKLEKAVSAKGFASQRAAGQYVGVCTRPDVCAALQLIAPDSMTVPESDFKALHAVIDFMKSTEEVGLKFIPLDLSTARIVLVTDASFANARKEKSQLGFIVILADKDDRANILHYASVRCKRVTRSVLAAEVHALIAGFDMAYLVQHMMHEIMDRKLPIEAYVDSRTMFQIVTKDSATAEKRLRIDLSALRESYNEGEIRKLGWIPGITNPADTLTKASFSFSSPLYQLMSSNRLNLDPLGWATSMTKDSSEATESDELTQQHAKNKSDAVSSLS